MAAATAATAAFLFSFKKSHISHSNPNLSLNPQLYPSLLPSLHLAPKRFHPLTPCSAVQDIAVDEPKEETLEIEEEEAQRRKLCVKNFPWSLSASDLEKVFGECGAVTDVEIIKQKNGKSRGFAFITMGSEEEGKAAAEKFDSFELMGRIIRVEFAKSFKKPSLPPLPPPSVPREDGHYKIYASNLAWKARSNSLRDFFSEKFNPVTARVVFDSPTGRSAGFGFVGFATIEEAEAAISELDGKELMGRPLRLKISERTGDESGEESEADATVQQSEES